MKYNNDSIRRQNRLLPEDRAQEILQNGEYGFLAMISADAGYGIPLSYVWQDDAIYIHCATEGEKLRALSENNHVSFCVVGHTQVIPPQFTTVYESVIVKGRALLNLTDTEKMFALELILDKYSPNDKITGMKYAEKSFLRTSIIKIEIENTSGKSKVNNA